MNEIELEAIESVKLIDGVVETLEKLKQLGLKLGIITRGCREYVDQVLKKLELEAYIDCVAARDSVSKPKPDPEHPRYLLKILGVETSEALLIGNHQMDALCAENAGIKYYLIPREELHDRNHNTLRNIRDLVHVVAEKSR